MLINKTRVFKTIYANNPKWMVSYYYPYGGVMCADFETWQKAIDFAFKVEEDKQWI